MRAAAWGILIWLTLPGCLLVQPLDEAKPEADGGSNGKAGSGPHSGGSGPSAAGSGNQAGSGPAAGGSGPGDQGGGSNGGGANGPDFSLFTGTWTVKSGETTTSCDGSTPTTTAATPGATDTFGLGTISDLILNPGTACEILADVSDDTASLNLATPECTFSQDGYQYDVLVDSFDFQVDSDGNTATATMSTDTIVTDANDNSSNCTTYSTWDYER